MIATEKYDTLVLYLTRQGYVVNIIDYPSGSYYKNMWQINISTKLNIINLKKYY